MSKLDRWIDQQNTHETPKPVWQSWTPTLTGWSGTPIVTARYVVHGSTVHFTVSVVGTSNDEVAWINLPTGLTAANIHANHEWNGACQIATSTNQAAAGRWRIGNNGTYISVDTDWADGNWATTGAKAVKLSGFYEAK